MRWLPARTQIFGWVVSSLLILPEQSYGWSPEHSVIPLSCVWALHRRGFGTFLPSLLLSGLMYDLNMMPPDLQWISAVVPARYFITVMRGIFLKGVGIPVLYGQGLAMIAYSVAGLALAIRAFRKEIE